MRTLLLYVVAFAASGAALGQAPGAPMLTVGTEFKGLRFDWDPVPLADNYRLEYRACSHCAYVAIATRPSAAATDARFMLPLHLFDWTNARYRLRACNAQAQCSTSPAVSVSGLRRDAVGYFKPAHTRIGMQFGSDTDLSPDGRNLVATAPGDGNVVYVFRRRADRTWVQRARLEPQPDVIRGVNQMSVSISADGNTVAVGLIPCHEVFVFRFDGAAWTRTRLRRTSSALFGKWVGLNAAGDTLATARGVNLDPRFPHLIDIYRLMDGVWRPVRTFEESSGRRESCGRGVMSRDGSTIAEPCADGLSTYVRTHSGPDWTVRQDLPLLVSTRPVGFLNTGIGIDASGDTIAAQVLLDGTPPIAGPGIVHVFKRTAGAYAMTTTLKPGAWRRTGANSAFGFDVAVSGDGATIAVGDTYDNGLGAGVQQVPLTPGPDVIGAVYVYRLRGSWRLVNVVKPNYHPVDIGSFGEALALSGSGHTLIVGEPSESSSAAGIGGDWLDTGAIASGAVWMY